MSNEPEKVEAKYLDVQDVHCLKCHGDFTSLEHVQTCPEEVKNCGKLVGKACEFQQAIIKK